MDIKHKREEIEILSFNKHNLFTETKQKDVMLTEQRIKLRDALDDVTVIRNMNDEEKI